MVTGGPEEWEKRLNDLQRVEKNFLFFLENTSDYIYFKNINHQFTYTSNAFAVLTGHSHWQELVGKTDFDVFPKEHADLYFSREHPVIAEGQELTWLEEPYYNQEGELCWVSSSKRPIRNDQQEIVGLFGISRDITRVKQLEAKLSFQANYDCLTGLSNRSFFQKQAEQYISLAHRNGQTLAFFFIDLDDFKDVNDNFGHEAGDVVLRTTGERLSRCFRESDLIGRLGGDEFVILAVTDGMAASIGVIEEQIRRHIGSNILYQNRLLRISCSIGVACFPDNGRKFTELMRNADHALYRAKQAGKNTCCSAQGESKSMNPADHLADV